MVSRCAPSRRAYLPFLYPSLFRANGGASLARTGLRHSSSDIAATDATTRLNPAPDDYAMPHFADKAKLTVYAGGGGHGCISFLREMFLAEGPANGGDGGHGGNVYIQAVHGETSLHKLTRRRFVRAGKGKHGQGSSRGGTRGDDVVITVPVGTIVRELSRNDPEAENVFLGSSKKNRKRQSRAPVPVPKEAGPGEEQLEDPERHKWLLYPGISSTDARNMELPPLPSRDRLFAQPKPPLNLDLFRPTPRPILLAAGGLGGLGNPHFVSRERMRPLFATKGEEAMSIEIELELKLLADLGLVGLPNAGKSTLLRAMSNSRARVGSWAFTTLQPNIGTVVLDNNKGRPLITSFHKQTEVPNTDTFAGAGLGTEAGGTETVRRARFTVADIPGLIEGAHLDKGLGIAFLRHVERAGVLAFVIDLGAGNAVAALKALWTEVGLYAQMREEEERNREREARIDWGATAGTSETDDMWPAMPGMADYQPPDPTATGGLHIAAKPWFVVATKGDLPNTQENFRELREYLASISRGEEPHPSGVEGAWTENCTVIPVSAINGHGVDRPGAHRPYQTYPEIVKEHKRFEDYYNNLLKLPEDEKVEFWAALKRELPNSFRFCGSKGHALAVKRLLQTRYIPEITSIAHDGGFVQPPTPVAWYPDSLAWSMTTPKNVIRKFPPFAAFQKFLVSETSVGNISRQEVVSMIPPLLMDLRPSMTVLDMCAAPGSKAAQLLEMVHRGEEARIRHVIKSFSDFSVGTLKTEDQLEEEAAQLDADPSDDGRATGMLIANDADYKRSHMLIHQLKRLSSPNMIVTNHDATMYPSLRIPNPQDPSKPNYLKFDRILADVPCSGDGTLRKNVNLWKDWNPGSALGLHVTQVRILVRALQMLKPGGRVVYSTCSMNPVENESVVAAAMERCGGLENIEIVDCQDQLPLLKRKPGLKSWQIIDKTGKTWNTWEEVEEYAKTTEDGLPPARLASTMFPRPGQEDIPLERCMRVYAHQQDTGGFFITVLHKKKEFKAKPEKEGVQPTSTKTNVVKRPLEEEDDKKTVAKKQKTAEEGSTNSTTPMDADIAAPEPVSEVKEESPEAVPEASEESAAVAELEPVVEEAETAAEPAVEEKLVADDASIPDAAVTESSAATLKVETPSADKPPQEKKRKQEGPYEEPFKYLSPDNDVIKNVESFYKISPRFPTDRYMVRNSTGEPAKAVYYTSALVRDILVLNEGRGVKFIHGGVKMFVKQDAPSADVCRWRIQSEGIPILQGYVGEERVIVLNNKETLRKLLVEMFPKFANNEWESLGEIGERVRNIGLGCCVLRVEPDGTDEDFVEHTALPLWKSFQSLNLMLPKEDRSAMLLRIFNDTTPLVNIVLKNQLAAKAEQANGDVKTEEANGEEVNSEEFKAEETTMEVDEPVVKSEEAAPASETSEVPAASE
ncbi:mitochondrial GTPase 2-like protein [Podospora didyma]|uniref:Mitochondrial GTPase 2-like protein n=1 Tax=Podospora didyma TaxID=330526 RepID=A0AAE0P0K2_9PEZI|nr:mitochondrial GTPase 2-like protein [Podospora didyma]